MFKMSLKFLFFVVLLSIANIGTTHGQICPPAEELSHCECNEDTLKFYCHGGDPRLDLKAEFDRISPFINDSVVFQELQIKGIYIYEIKAETVKTLKFRKVLIEYNDRLKSIHPDAFPGTYNTTTDLVVWYNEIENAENATEFFDFVNKFKNVERLIISHNNIQYIPDYAFGLLPNLRNLEIGPCVLHDIGSRIFANLPNLDSLVMSSSDLSIEEFKNDTFEGIGNNVVVDLEHNPFSRVPQEIFRPVLDKAAELKVGGEYCFLVCNNVLLDCDQQADWICENEDAYGNKLKGFFCRDGQDVWNYCRNNNSTLF